MQALVSKKRIVFMHRYVFNTIIAVTAPRRKRRGFPLLRLQLA